MKNSLFSELMKTTIPVLDASEKIISYAFIFEFIVPEDNSKVIPFLILNYLDIKDQKMAKLEFTVSENSVQEKYYVAFDNHFINDMRLNDYVVFPIANLINECKNSGKVIQYTGINEKWLIDLENPKTRSIETLSYINYGKFDINDEYTPYVQRTYNCIPFYNEKCNYFMIEAETFSSLGYPVLLVEEGSYYNGEGLCLGTRIVFVGIASKDVNGKVLVHYPNYLVQDIKKKYKSMFEKNE